MENELSAIEYLELKSKSVRIVTILSIHDVHGLVDGVANENGKLVGGMDGIHKTVDKHRTGERNYDSSPDDIFVYIVGDMLADWHHRCVHSGTALTIWEWICNYLQPDGITYGNHELVYSEVMNYTHPNIHCHNLDDPGENECVKYARPCRKENAIWGPCNNNRIYFKGFPFSGIVARNKDANVDIGDVAVGARHCPDHWEALNIRQPYILLAHYGDEPPYLFTPPDYRYQIVLKAHDHQRSEPTKFWVRANNKPIVVESTPNGRSVGFLELMLDSNNKVLAWNFTHDRHVTSQGCEAWSVQMKLPKVTSTILLENLDCELMLSFGGGVPPDHPQYYRIRAVCLGLRSLRNLFQRRFWRNHLFLMSPTAISDDAIVPYNSQDTHMSNIDVFDIRSVYGSKSTHTMIKANCKKILECQNIVRSTNNGDSKNTRRCQYFNICPKYDNCNGITSCQQFDYYLKIHSCREIRNSHHITSCPERTYCQVMEGVLWELLNSEDLRPITYIGDREIIGLYNDAIYRFCMDDNDNVIANRLNGPACEPLEPCINMADEFANVSRATLPDYELKRVTESNWEDVNQESLTKKLVDLRNILGSDVDDTSLVSAVVRMLKSGDMGEKERYLHGLLTC